MNNWQAALIDWRCKLSAAERHRYGAPPGWNCRDVKISVGRIAFDQLDPQRAAALNAVETSFKLPPEQVDMVIAAGPRCAEKQLGVPLLCRFARRRAATAQRAAAGARPDFASYKSARSRYGRLGAIAPQHDVRSLSEQVRLDLRNRMVGEILADFGHDPLFHIGMEGPAQSRRACAAVRQ